MFSAIATIAAVSWVLEHKVEACIFLALLIFLIYRLATHNSRQARKAQLAAQAASEKRTQDLIRENAERERKAEADRRQRDNQIEDAIRKAIIAAPGSEKYRSSQFQTEINYKEYNLSEFKLYSNGKYTVLDFETTGLSPYTDRIVEIGACKVSDGQILMTYHQYVDPEMPISPDASAVNHITNAMVSGKPKIYELLPSLLSFIGDDIVVAHNASFDMQFLAHSCMQYRFICPQVSFDSMILKELWPDIPNRKLSTFLDVSGIENKNAHSAAGDAGALALLMILAMKMPYQITPPKDFDFGYSVGHFTGTVEKVDDKLHGLKFVITGEIDGYEREDFEKMIATHGGRCTLKVSPSTDYLIVGSFKNLPVGYISAKEEFARKLSAEGGKVKIISQEDFYAMLN